MEEENIVASIDLGSSKTTVLISRINGPSNVELVGIGISESRGIKAGGVTNIELTIRSIKEAVEEALKEKKESCEELMEEHLYYNSCLSCINFCYLIFILFPKGNCCREHHKYNKFQHFSVLTETLKLQFHRHPLLLLQFCLFS